MTATDSFTPETALASMPLLPAAAGMGAGILCALSEISDIMPYILAGTLTAGSIAMYCVRGRIMMFFLSLLAGIILGKTAEPLPLSLSEGVWSGRIETLLEGDSYWQTTVRIDSLSAGEMPPLAIPSTPVKAIIEEKDNLILRPGFRIRFKGMLIPAENTADLPYRKTESETLSRKGISAKTFAREVEVVDSGYGFRGMSDHFREYCRTLIMRSRLSTPAKEFFVATLLGDRSLLSENEREAFSRSGLAHVLALSGLHIGVLALLLGYLFWPFRILGMGRKTYNLVLCPILWLFAFFTGMSPSVTRAVIMASVIIFSRILDRSHSPFNALCLAWIILLVYNPFYIFDLGFQLSFGAVAAILMFASELSPFQKSGPLLRTSGQAIGVSLAAVSGTAVISAAAFHTFPLFFLVSNLIATPFMIPLIGCGLLHIICLLWGTEPAWICLCVDTVYGIIRSINEFGNTGFIPLSIDNIFPPVWAGILWTTALIGWRIWLSDRKLATAIFSTAITSAACFTIFISSRPEISKAPGIYLMRDSEYTSLLIHNGNKAELMTSAPERAWDRLLEETVGRNREFFYRQSVDSIAIRSPQMIHSGYATVVLIDNCRKVRHTDRRISHAVIGGGFTGNLGFLLDSIEVDTVIFSHRLPYRYMEKMKEECEANGIPWISLRDRPFAIQLL